MRLVDADALRECFEPADFDNDDGFENCWNAVRITDAAPTIEAIPVEWLEEHDSEGNEYGRWYITVVEALLMWQKEQEAQDT